MTALLIAILIVLGLILWMILGPDSLIATLKVSGVALVMLGIATIPEWIATVGILALLGWVVWRVVLLPMHHAVDWLEAQWHASRTRAAIVRRSTTVGDMLVATTLGAAVVLLFHFYG